MESALYDLVEPFEDALRDKNNEIDDLEFELEEGHHNVCCKFSRWIDRGSRYKEPINVQVSFIDYLVFKVFGATAFMNRYADYMTEIIFQEYISMDENIKYKKHQYEYKVSEDCNRGCNFFCTWILQW